jgi:hypothetical protein
MVVRDEEAILPFNLQYHLDYGFDHIFVLDNGSVDRTPEILQRFKETGRVTAAAGSTLRFDHERLANELLDIALRRYSPDWIFLLDADEFIDTNEPLCGFLQKMEQDGVRYGTIKWLNALNEPGLSHALRTTTFFEPWTERDWQEEGHFRKAFCRTHQNMRIVVGGHYFRTEVNPVFFSEQEPSPILIDIQAARILHYENRFTAPELLRKWGNLSLNLIEPGYDPESPWNEKLLRIRQYLAEYGSNPSQLWADRFACRRTFWGGEVPQSRIRREARVKVWFDASKG